MTTLLLTLAAFAVAMSIMAVGIVFNRPCLRGSCGGPDVLGRDGKPLTCATCPNRKRHSDKRRETSRLPVIESEA